MPPSHFQTGNKTIAKWLGEALGDTEKTWVNKEGKTVPARLVKVALMHVSPSGEKEIDYVSIGTDYDAERLLKVADRFIGKADTDAAGHNGRQQFVLYPFYEGDNQPQGRLPFYRNGHLVNESGDTSSEPPTVEGRLQQRMRHDEAYSQMLITATANLINQQNRFIELTSARAENAMVENMQMFTALREMSLREALNAHEHKMKELSAERTNKVIEGAVKLAPALMNRLTGVEIVPQSTADTAILEAIASAITPDDLTKLAPILSKLHPPVVGLLMARLEELERAKQEREKALTQTLEENQGLLSNGAARNELEH